MKNKKSPYKDVTNQFKEILEKTSQPLEWNEYETENGKFTLPFWKVVSSSGQSYEEFMKWYKAQKSHNKDDLSGAVVVPKAEFDLDSTTESTVSTDYKVQIEKNLENLKKTKKFSDLTDKTGAVKPKSDVEVNKIDEVKNTKLKKEDKDQTGVVSPKSDVKVNKVDGFSTTKLKKEEKDQTGVVKVQSEFETGNSVKLDNDFSKPFTPVVISDFEETMLDRFKKLNIED